MIVHQLTDKQSEIGQLNKSIQSIREEFQGKMLESKREIDALKSTESELNTPVMKTQVERLE
jgi:hypothetical protein